MDGIGEKLAEQLCSSGLVSSLADLYRLEDRERELIAWRGWQRSPLAMSWRNSTQPGQ